MDEKMEGKMGEKINGREDGRGKMRRLEGDGSNLLISGHRFATPGFWRGPPFGPLVKS